MRLLPAGSAFCWSVLCWRCRSGREGSDLSVEEQSEGGRGGGHTDRDLCTDIENRWTPHAAGRCGDDGVEALGRVGRWERGGGLLEQGPGDNERREGRYWMDGPGARTVGWAVDELVFKHSKSYLQGLKMDLLGVNCGRAEQIANTGATELVRGVFSRCRRSERARTLDVGKDRWFWMIRNLCNWTRKKKSGQLATAGGSSYCWN